MSDLACNDGGPAFPQWDGHAITGEPLYLIGGMSLRDWFAGMALKGLLASPRKINGKTEVSQDDLAGSSYGMADAMLQERLKRSP